MKTIIFLASVGLPTDMKNVSDFGFKYGHIFGISTKIH